MTILSRAVDEKGRLTLGKAFANQFVIIQELADGVVQICRAQAVPEAELWLHKNPKVIQAVMEGIAQAREGTLVEGPDLEEMSELAKKMGV